MLAKAARTRIRVRRNPPIEAERWIRDPRGIEVLLSARVWVDHVVRRHYYMAARYHDVVAVIQAPASIAARPASHYHEAVSSEIVQL